MPRKIGDTWYLTLEEYLFLLTYLALRDEEDLHKQVRDLTVPTMIALGKPMGRGGTNDVYEVSANPYLLLKNAGASKGTSREYDALVRMEERELTTVRRALVKVDGNPMILMNRVLDGIDSKSIVGYQRDLTSYIAVDKDFPCPNARKAAFVTTDTVYGLFFAFQQIVDSKDDFADYQFMLDDSGVVIHNDPTAIIGYKASTSTKIIIQAILDTWEYTNHPLARGMSWMTFKQMKRALSIHRVRTFGRALGAKVKYDAPSFCILDYRVLDWKDTFFGACCFRAKVDVNLAGWVKGKVGDEYWYSPVENLPKPQELLGSVHYEGSQPDEDDVKQFLQSLTR